MGTEIGGRRIGDGITLPIEPANGLFTAKQVAEVLDIGYEAALMFINRGMESKVARDKMDPMTWLYSQPRTTIPGAGRRVPRSELIRILYPVEYQRSMGGND